LYVAVCSIVIANSPGNEVFGGLRTAAVGVGKLERAPCHYIRHMRLHVHLHTQTMTSGRKRVADTPEDLRG
jgi:hypothetical protein